MGVPQCILLSVCSILLTTHLTASVYGDAPFLLGMLFAAVATLSLLHVERRRSRELDFARRSEARHRQQITSMPVACLGFSPELEITGWNPAAESVFGWSAREVLGRSATMLIPPAVSPGLEGLWRDLLHDKPRESVNQNLTKDGRTITCAWANTPLTDESGAVVGFISMARDITAETEAQEELSRAERRHRDLLDNLPHYIFSVDNEGRYLAANAANCSLLGRSESEIIGRTFRDVGLPEEIAEEFLRENEACRNAGRTIVIDLGLPLDGASRQFRVIITPIRSDEGVITGTTGIAIDVTEQRAAEEAASVLRMAVEQLQEVMFTTDPEGIITYVNPAFEKVYGYRSEEVLGRTPRILKSGEIPPEMTEHLWSELLAGRPFRGEYRNRSRSGELVDVVSLASPILDDQGKVRGFVAIQQDVTSEKIAEAERRTMDIRLAQLAKMEALGTLAGRMAHDFNNILSIVLSHADLIERLETQSSRTDKAVETIRKAVQRGASVAGQVLNFARVSEVQRGRIDIADLILELSSMLSESLPETVHLTVDLAPDLPEIEGDSGQLHQAILNLCMNARDAMPGGGDVKIEARPVLLGSGTIAGAAAGEYLLVRISDNGSGIESDTLENIFDPFFSTKDKSKGTGLGLAIVYGIVTAHGGVIEVDSTVGKGTAFRIYLPVRDEVDGSGVSLPSDAACEA